MNPLPALDSIFHQPVRTKLAILLYGRTLSFADLKRQLGITDGNLDAHLKKLASSGYLESQMVLEGRPHTVYRLSGSGRKAFEGYRSAILMLLALSHATEGEDDQTNRRKDV